MASSIFECEICSENYDIAEHKPIVLLCGHSFCRKCLLFVEREGEKKCPTCRQSIPLLVDQLPVNYVLIPSEGKTAAGNKHIVTSGKCQIHGCDLDNFCVSCEVITCSKCAKKFHVEHRIEEVEDVINKDHLASNFASELQSKMEAMITYMAESISSTSNIRNYLKEIDQGLQQWEDMLLAKNLSATQDLAAWDDAKAKSAEERHELFKNLLRFWKDDFHSPSKDLLVLHVKTRLEELPTITKTIDELLSELPSSSSSGLQISFGSVKKVKFSFDNDIKTVSTNADPANTVVCMQNQRPSSLTIALHPSEPAPRFIEVLDTAASVCFDDVHIGNLLSFWGDCGETHESIISFHANQRHELSLLYGFSDDAAPVNNAKGQSRLQMGVRLATMSDFCHCKAMALKPCSVSCIQGLPAEVGTLAQELGWLPRHMHFPDLQDGDVDWACKILKPFMRKLVLWLPRCHLTEKGFNDFFEKCSDGFSVVLSILPGYKMTIHCESTSVSPEVQLGITNQGRWKNIGVLWT